MAGRQAQRRSGRWVPIEVRTRWFSFLSVEDLAKCGAVCKSWLVLVDKTYETEFQKHACVPAPVAMPRIAKLQLLDRVRRPTIPKHMAFLITMAAGRRDMLPYLHHLLLLRDRERLRLSVPGGLFHSQHPEVMGDLSDAQRGMFQYRTAATYHPDWGDTTPLCRAATTGNDEAIHLLLMFGDNPNQRDKKHRRPLQLACDQGNTRSVEALLGRTSLRPPNYEPRVIRRLGLRSSEAVQVGRRAAWLEGSGHFEGSFAGADLVSSWDRASKRVRSDLPCRPGPGLPPALQAGPGEQRDSEAAVAIGRPGAPVRTLNGPLPTQALTRAEVTMGQPADGLVPGTRRLSTRERQVLLALGDGRRPEWSGGLDMGTFWSANDTSVNDDQEAEARRRARQQHRQQQQQQQEEAAAAAGGGNTTQAQPFSFMTRGEGGEEEEEEKEDPEVVYARHMAKIKQLLTKAALPWSRQSQPPAVPQGQHLLANPNEKEMAAAAEEADFATDAPVSAAALGQRQQAIHPRLPRLPDEGAVAARATANRIKINFHSPDGKTPLIAAAEHGRVEIVALLLSHHDPSLLASAEVPPIPQQGAGGGLRPEPLELGRGTGPEAGAGGASGSTAAARASKDRSDALVRLLKAAAVLLPPDAAPPAGSISERCITPALEALLSAAGAAVACPPQHLALLADKPERCDPDYHPANRHTALCHACVRGDSVMAGLLVHFGANVNEGGYKDQTPLLLASMAGHEHVLFFLLRVGLDPADAAKAAAEVDRIILDRSEGGGGSGVREPGNGSKKGKEKTKKTKKKGNKAAVAAAGGDGDGGDDNDDGAGSDAAGEGEEDNDEDDDEDASPTARPAKTPKALPVVAPEPTLKLFFGTPQAAAGGRVVKRKPKRPTAGNGEASKDAGEAASRPTGSRLFRSLSGRQAAESDLAQRLGAAGRSASRASNATDDDNDGDDADSKKPEGPELKGLGGQVLDLEALRAGARGRRGYDRMQRAGSRGRMRRRRGGAADDDDVDGAHAEQKQRAAVAVAARGRGQKGKAEPETPVVEACTTAREQAAATAAFVFPRDNLLKRLLRVRAVLLLRQSRVTSGAGAVLGREELAVNVQDHSGFTPLFLAATAGRDDSVRALLAAGADHTIETKRGKTVVYGAVEKSQTEVVRALVPYLSARQIRQMTTFGTNVLHAAQKHGNRVIIDLLERHLARQDRKEARRLERAEALRVWGKDGVDKVARAKKQNAAMDRLTSGAKRSGLGAHTPSAEEDAAAEAEEEALAGGADPFASKLRQLRRMADQARAKADEDEARRRARKQEAVAAAQPVATSKLSFGDDLAVGRSAGKPPVAQAERHAARMRHRYAAPAEAQPNRAFESGLRGADAGDMAIGPVGGVGSAFPALAEESGLSTPMLTRAAPAGGSATSPEKVAARAGRAKDTMKLAASAYGAPVVGRKRKKKKGRRPTQVDPLAML